MDQRRQAHEQLRIDHIKTLEELQRCKDENERLKEVLKMCQLTPAAAPAESKSETLAEYVDKIRKQDKEIQELKTLLRTTSLDDQKRFNAIHSRTVEEFSVQLTKLQQHERELIDQISKLNMRLGVTEALEQRNSTMEAEVASLRAQLAHSATTIKSRVEDVLQLSDEKGHLERELCVLRDRLAEAVAASLTCSACNLKAAQLRDKDIVIADCNMQIEQHAAMMMDMETVCEALRRELAECRQQLDRPSSPKRPKALAVDFKDSDSEDEQHPAMPSPITDPQSPHVEVAKELPPLLPMPSFPRMPSMNMRDDDDCSVGSVNSMSVRFQEFIRLKRENKELKLRLADLYAGTGKVAAPLPVSNLQRQFSSPNLGLAPTPLHPLKMSSSSVRLPAMQRPKNKR